MNENVGKSPDQLENAEWQNRLKLDAGGVSDDFAGSCRPVNTDRRTAFSTT